MLNLDEIMESAAFISGEIGDTKNEIHEARREIARIERSLAEYHAIQRADYGERYMSLIGDVSRSGFVAIHDQLARAHDVAAQLHEDRARLLARLNSARR